MTSSSPTARNHPHPSNNNPHSAVAPDSLPHIVEPALPPAHQSDHVHSFPHPTLPKLPAVSHTPSVTQTLIPALPPPPVPHASEPALHLPTPHPNQHHLHHHPPSAPNDIAAISNPDQSEQPVPSQPVPSQLLPPPDAVAQPLPSASIPLSADASAPVATVTSPLQPGSYLLPTQPIPSQPVPTQPAVAPSTPQRKSAAVLLRGESISLARRAAVTAKKRREEARAELERQGIREGVESALEGLVGSSASTRANVSQNKTKRLKRVKWKEEEVNALREGVKKYGEGRWAVILREYATAFHQVRISVDLKDKWRNLFKSGKARVPLHDERFSEDHAAQLQPAMMGESARRAGQEKLSQHLQAQHHAMQQARVQSDAVASMDLAVQDERLRSAEERPHATEEAIEAHQNLQHTINRHSAVQHSAQIATRPQAANNHAEMHVQRTHPEAHMQLPTVQHYPQMQIMDPQVRATEAQMQVSAPQQHAHNSQLIQHGHLLSTISQDDVPDTQIHIEHATDSQMHSVEVPMHPDAGVHPSHEQDHVVQRHEEDVHISQSIHDQKNEQEQPSYEAAADDEHGDQQHVQYEEQAHESAAQHSHLSPHEQVLKSDAPHREHVAMHEQEGHPSEHDQVGLQEQMEQHATHEHVSDLQQQPTQDPELMHEADEHRAEEDAQHPEQVDGHAQAYGVHEHEEGVRVQENGMDDGGEMVQQQEYSLQEAAQHDEATVQYEHADQEAEEQQELSGGPGSHDQIQEHQRNAETDEQHEVPSLVVHGEGIEDDAIGENVGSHLDDTVVRSADGHAVANRNGNDVEPSEDVANMGDIDQAPVEDHVEPDVDGAVDAAPVDGVESNAERVEEHAHMTENAVASVDGNADINEGVVEIGVAQAEVLAERRMVTADVHGVDADRVPEANGVNEEDVAIVDDDDVDCQEEGTVQGNEILGDETGATRRSNDEEVDVERGGGEEELEHGNGGHHGGDDTRNNEAVVVPHEDVLVLMGKSDTDGAIGTESCLHGDTVVDNDRRDSMDEQEAIVEQDQETARGQKRRHMDMDNGSEEKQKNGRIRSSGDEEREGVEDVVEEEGLVMGRSFARRKPRQDVSSKYMKR